MNRISHDCGAVGQPSPNKFDDRKADIQEKCPGYSGCTFIVLFVVVVRMIVHGISPIASDEHVGNTHYMNPRVALLNTLLPWRLVFELTRYQGQVLLA